MKIWLVQFKAELYDKAKNSQRIADYIDRASDAGVHLIVFPELALTGYSCGKRFYELAEPIPGPSTVAIMEKAKEKSIYVTFGMPEARGILMHNSAPLFGPDGLVGVSRKLHLATSHRSTGMEPEIQFKEGLYFAKGFASDLVTFDTSLGRLGIEICKDNSFPEICRYHALKGAFLVLCVSGMPGSIDRSRLIARARAAENTIWLCWVNLVGKEKEDSVPFAGGSCVIDYNGNIIRSASIGSKSYEEALACEIDVDEWARFKLSDPFLRDARPELTRRLAQALESVETK